MTLSQEIVPPTLTSLRRKAANNSLEVEHILGASALRIAGLPELLDELANAQNWSDTNRLSDGTHVVPLARWGRVASMYCRYGLEGLQSVLNEPGHESFVLALLEELHSREAVDAMLDFFSECIASPADDVILSCKIASSLNFILCFRPEVEIDAVTRSRIRNFATELIGLASTQVERAVPVLLLRAVGDEDSLDFLDTLPPFTENWATTIPTTRKVIRKRLKTTEG